MNVEAETLIFKGLYLICNICVIYSLSFLWSRLYFVQEFIKVFSTSLENLLGCLTKPQATLRTAFLLPLLFLLSSNRFYYSLLTFHSFSICFDLSVLKSHISILLRRYLCASKSCCANTHNFLGSRREVPSNCED